MPPSRLLAILSSDPDGPVVRHRWRAYERQLAAADIVLEVVPWPKDSGHRRLALQRASAADGVILSSRLLGLRDVARLRRRARRLAFDFDDALPFRDSRRGATASRTRRRRFRAIVTQADRVLAGNAYLASLVAEAGATASVFPTTVVVSEGPPAPEPDPQPIVIGWIGSRATLPYVAAQAATLSALAADGPAYRLRIIADARPALPPGIQVDFVPWQLDSWSEHLVGIHLGMAPLSEDAWSRGKCGLKILQMLALGRPVVASDVGVQRDLVRHGETGFVAADPQAFEQGLRTLMEDPVRRRSMGTAGREDVRARWSVSAWAPKIVAEVEALLA